LKITGVKILKRTCNYVNRYARELGPITKPEHYDEYAYRYPPIRSTGENPGQRIGHFIEVNTDEGISGQYGIIESKPELLAIMDGLKDYVIGKDPLDSRMIWDMMSRYDRHARSGIMMMAISALDIAIWDLKGKILGQPVYKILGGGRNKVRPYVSTLGFSVEPEAAKKRALEIKAMGIRAQKWFFRYGPAHGAEGLRKNLDMAFALREVLGDDYEIMFDCSMNWTVNYARRMFNELESVRPVWVEEVLRAHMIDGFRHLRDSTSIPLAAGEHIYTRMEVNAYLQDNIFSFMQSDPVWCGGITESIRIADLCEMYSVTYAPHGHALMPAVHVVASMPPDVSPYCEYLIAIMDSKNAFFKERPIDKDGFISLNETPGLGEELDEERIISTEQVQSFGF